MIDTSSVTKRIIREYDGKILDLVMSDEFTVEGRKFGKNDDAIFEAIEKPDNTNEAIQFCMYFF
jgi:hypothetical protein